MATTTPRSGSARGAAKPKSVIPSLSWDAATVAPVVLVTGPEGFLADRASSTIRDQLRDADPNVEIHDVDATDYAYGTLTSLASPSLFGEPRLIRVSNVEKCNDEFLEDALAYIEATDSDTTLILRHSGGVRGKRLLDQIRAGVGNGTEVVCAEIKSDADKHDFTVAEFRRAGRSITPGAVRALVSAFSSSGSELANACAQLMADADGDIDERLVEQYYGGRVETTAFKVADFALAGRRGDALVSLRHALETGADPVPIVATFASKLRLMAKVWGDRRSANELASVVGAAPWQNDRARRDLQSGWDEPGLRIAIIAVAEADANVKGASRDPVYSIERMIEVVANFGRS
ncbi:MAG: DNA polymerase III subunit delta [Microbacteriaceae bacterium]